MKTSAAFPFPQALKSVLIQSQSGSGFDDQPDEAIREEDKTVTEYLTEQEQIEILKNWFKQYIFVIIAGIAISIALVTGWRYWQDHKLKILNQSSQSFDEMLSKRAQNDEAGTLTAAQHLFKTYPSTIYGQMAGLMLARENIANQKYAAASENLRWVMTKNKSASIRQIARLRLARVLIAEKKWQDALDLLATVDDDQFIGLIDEVKGDAYLALNQRKDARTYYGKALKEIPNVESIRPILQMKYDNLT